MIIILKNYIFDFNSAENKIAHINFSVFHSYYIIIYQYLVIYRIYKFKNEQAYEPFYSKCEDS